MAILCCSWWINMFAQASWDDNFIFYKGDDVFEISQTFSHYTYLDTVFFKAEMKRELFVPHPPDTGMIYWFEIQDIDQLKTNKLFQLKVKIIQLNQKKPDILHSLGRNTYLMKVKKRGNRYKIRYMKYWFSEA